MDWWAPGWWGDQVHSLRGKIFISGYVLFLRGDLYFSDLSSFEIVKWILDLGISNTLTFISWKKWWSHGNKAPVLKHECLISNVKTHWHLRILISLRYSLRLSFIELALNKTRNIVWFGPLENKTYLKIYMGLIDHVPTKTTNIQSMIPRKLKYQEVKTYPSTISTY